MNKKLNVVLDATKIGLALMCFIIVTGLFIPIIMCGFIVSISDKITMADCVLHPIFIVFTVIGMIIAYFVIMTKMGNHEQEVRFQATSYSKSHKTEL